MGKKAEKKTNAMRALDVQGIPYEVLQYSCEDESFDGCDAARQVGLPFSQVFKTLVTKSGDRVVVCCIPVDKHLDLKALASASGNKKLDMLPMNELLATTGYQRGGCSPVGMKKSYPTFVDRSALDHERIAVSAGQRGMQLLVGTAQLTAFVDAQVGNFTM